MLAMSAVVLLFLAAPWAGWLLGWVEERMQDYWDWCKQQQRKWENRR